MASRPAGYWSVSYEEESSFAEDVDTAAIRLRATGDVDVSGLQYPSQDINIVKQYPSEGSQRVRMPMGGEFTVEMPLAGLGGSAASTPPASALVTYMSYVFGVGSSWLATGQTATGGTASVPTTSGVSGISPGGLVRFGALGDGRANGQWAAVGAHGTSSATLLTALPAAPTNGDVIYCARGVYASESHGTFETITSTRFELKSNSQQYLCHGCWPKSVEFVGLNPGDIPLLRVTWGVAWWELISGTFPDATTPYAPAPTPIAGGSFFMNAVGTVTRSTMNIRKFSMNLQLDNKPEIGPGGVNDKQVIIGCYRGPSKCTISMVYDSEAAGTDTLGDLFDVDGNSRVNRHALYSMSCANGRSLALYFPNLHFTGQVRPLQINDDGANRKMIEFEANTGATTTSDATLSPWRMGFA